MEDAANFHFVVREILQGNQPAVFCHFIGEHFCSFAAIKLFRTTFGDALERCHELRLLERVTGLEHLTFIQEDLLTHRKSLQS